MNKADAEAELKSIETLKQLNYAQYNHFKRLFAESRITPAMMHCRAKAYGYTMEGHKIYKTILENEIKGEPRDELYVRLALVNTALEKTMIELVKLQNK